MRDTQRDAANIVRRILDELAAPASQEDKPDLGPGWRNDEARRAVAQAASAQGRAQAERTAQADDLDRQFGIGKYDPNRKAVTTFDGVTQRFGA